MVQEHCMAKYNASIEELLYHCYIGKKQNSFFVIFSMTMMIFIFLQFTICIFYFSLNLFSLMYFIYLICSSSFFILFLYLLFHYRLFSSLLFSSFLFSSLLFSSLLFSSLLFSSLLYSPLLCSILFYPGIGSTIISFILALFSGEFFQGISFLISNSDINTWLCFAAFCSFGYCGANFGAALTSQVILFYLRLIKIISFALISFLFIILFHFFSSLPSLLFSSLLFNFILFLFHSVPFSPPTLYWKSPLLM